MKQKKIFTLLGIGLFLCLSCSQENLDKRQLKNLLFQSESESGYKIEGISQGLKSLKNEYSQYIQMNFPSKLRTIAQSSSENWKEYVKNREKQDLIIVEALRNNLHESREFDYFVKQSLREALVKTYLYKTIPNLEKIKETQFSDDRMYLEKIYQENKNTYDSKKINKEDAMDALKKVYAKKKKAVIDYILQQEEIKTVEKLNQSLKMEEDQSLFKNKPELKK